MGITLALVTGVRIYFQYGKNYAGQVSQLSIVVGATIIATAVISKLVGGILPIAAKKLKLDPAIMAAPLITTIVDMCSILVFFRVAVLVMGI